MKPRTPNQKKRYTALNKRLSKYVSMVNALYDLTSQEAAKVAMRSGYDGEIPFKFKDYPSLKSKVNEMMRFFSHDLNFIIMSGTSEEWKQSNLVQDLLASDVLKAYGVKHGKEKFKKYYQPNNEALKAFQRRKDKGFTVSQKVWNQTYNLKQELEYAISSAIEKGTSAVTLSKRISKYLNDFPSLQKDYKQRFGKAVDCADCEYRSIRLARSEINMAYREAEQLRWQQMDFIKGYEIKLSGSHPKHDICDELAGIYPLWFKWTGWHPNDLCFTIPIVMTDDEWYSGKGERIDDVPSNFYNWCAINANRIAIAQYNGTEPYWVKDNSRVFDRDSIKGNSHSDFIKSFKSHLFFTENAKEEQNLTPFTYKQIENHIAVSKAIGVKQGLRMSFKQADSGRTNPNYVWPSNPINESNIGYTNNCTFAVATHELRMRGWDVTALPYDRNNIYHHSIRADYTSLWIDPETRKKPEPVFKNWHSEKQFLKGIKEEITDVGRYNVVYYTEQCGHIICMDKLPNGDFRFYDPQDDSLNITSWMKELRKNKTIQILRVDNLLINPSLIKHVVKRA